METPRQYLEELRSELALNPTWLPGEPIELGSFGRHVDGRFVADGRLADLGITMVSKTGDGKTDVRRSRGITFRIGSSTNASAGTFDAEVSVELAAQRQWAWAFAARGMSVTVIHNILEVQREVLEAQRSGQWRREWLLVCELRDVEQLNVLITRSKHASGRARARGTIAEPIDVLLQQDVSFELSADDVFQVANAKNRTALYGLRKLKGWLDPHLRAISGGGSDESADLSLLLANDEPLFAPTS